MKRRKFLSQSTKLGIAVSSVTLPMVAMSCQDEINSTDSATEPVSSTIITTWNNMEAVRSAQDHMASNKPVLDAIEQAIKTVENNPDDMSVGYGGRPDSSGVVSLDACIMNHAGEYGAVTYLKQYRHAISVARAVMEQTPHVILSGRGADDFAASLGFPIENLLTDKAKQEWEDWKKTSGKYQPKANIERHDTIGLLAMDKLGQMAGGCSTSGMAYKVPGRVGDSPIIGGGLFVDGDVGMATATGVGEEILKVVGSFLAVELMRQGAMPQKACEEAVKRVAKRNPVRSDDLQVAFVAMDKKGNTGGFSLLPGFEYAQYRHGKFEKIKSKSLLS